MKYILKKDFYTCPKGSEVVISSTATNWSVRGEELRWYNVIDKNGVQIKLGNSETMNVAEWIEEVKPREWYVLIDPHFGLVTGFEEEKLAVSYVNELNKKSEKPEIVKVREVIE